MNFTKHLETLVEISSQNLSEAHIRQHIYTANLIKKQFQLDTNGPGAFSFYKYSDNLHYLNNCLNGQKKWISFLPKVSWAILTIKHIDKIQVVLVKLDKSTKIEMISTSGMEETLTGHLTFDHTPCKILCSEDDYNYFFIRRQQSLAFIANLYGLAKGLYQDIDKHTLSQNIRCDSQKQKLKLQLDVVDLIWKHIPKNITDKHRSHYFWKQKNIAYSFAKKCLLEITQFMTEITNSGLYVSENIAHQRYKDALIYISHMKNLYFSLQD